MSQTSKTICETHILGPGTEVAAVRANPDDPREWLRSSPVCPLLREHGIDHVGIMRAEPGTHIVRLRLSGTFFLACLDGTGQILVDGRWRVIHPGTAVVQPPFLPNAIRTKGFACWTFCWTRYLESPGRPSIAGSHTPVSRPHPVQTIRAAIEGLRAAVEANSTAALLRLWCGLVHQTVVAFAKPPIADDERLNAVWRAVEERLNRSWTATQLAAIAGICPEHLRRLSVRQTGHAPLQHITYLRMRCAAEQLATSSATIHEIAQNVGYENPFAFSEAFLRWMGLRPSAFRKS